MNLFKEEEALITDVSNEYFSTEFSEYLTTDFMAFISICAALMLDTVDKKISRVSNAYTESHNKVEKHTVLKKRKNNSIGQVVRKLESHVDGLTYAFTLGDKAIITVSKKDKNEPIYPDDASNPLLSDVWNRGKEYKKPKESHFKASKLKYVAERIIYPRNDETNSEYKKLKIPKQGSKKFRRMPNVKKEDKKEEKQQTNEFEEKPKASKIPKHEMKNTLS